MKTLFETLVIDGILAERTSQWAGFIVNGAGHQKPLADRRSPQRHPPTPPSATSGATASSSVSLLTFQCGKLLLKVEASKGNVAVTPEADADDGPE